MPDERARAAIAAADRAQLEELAAVALDTLSATEDWLGSASTRQAAVDSLRRLAQALRRAGIPTYTHDDIRWRGSIIDAMERSGIGVGDDGEVRLVEPGQPNWLHARGPLLRELLDRAPMGAAR